MNERTAKELFEQLKDRLWKCSKKKLRKIRERTSEEIQKLETEVVKLKGIRLKNGRTER